MATTNLSGPLVVAGTATAATITWATSTATGGTANATGVVTGGYLQSASVVYFGTRKVGFTAASAGWTTGNHAVGDIYLNGAPAGGSAVGWICSGTGTGTAATFIGFGSIFAG